MTKTTTNTGTNNNTISMNIKAHMKHIIIVQPVSFLDLIVIVFARVSTMAVTTRVLLLIGTAQTSTAAARHPRPVKKEAGHHACFYSAQGNPQSGQQRENFKITPCSKKSTTLITETTLERITSLHRSQAVYTSLYCIKIWRRRYAQCFACKGISSYKPPQIDPNLAGWGAHLSGG